MNNEQAAGFYKALADPVRIGIIRHLLAKKRTCICHLAEGLKRDQSVLFRHVQILKSAGIVETEKEEKFLMCFLKDRNKARKLMEV